MDNELLYPVGMLSEKFEFKASRDCTLRLSLKSERGCIFWRRL
jgi:hypothetical protein